MPKPSRGILTPGARRSTVDVRVRSVVLGEAILKDSILEDEYLGYLPISTFIDRLLDLSKYIYIHVLMSRQGWTRGAKDGCCMVVLLQRAGDADKQFRYGVLP